MKLFSLIRCQSDQAGFHAFGDEGGEVFEVGLQLHEVIQLFTCFFIHIEGFINLDLQGVMACAWIGIFINTFNAFEGVVDGYGVAHGFYEITQGSGEFGIAGGAVAVTENKVNGAGFVADQADAVAGIGAACGHGVAVNVPCLAEIIMGLADEGFQCAMIGRVIGFYAVDDFFG